MTYSTNLSEKVTPQRLDTMYGNFVKITDWLIKGKQSQHAMPEPFAVLFDTAELVQAQKTTIAEQSNVIGGLQQRLAQQDGRIAALETTLQAVNKTLTQLVEIANAQAGQAQPTPAVQAQVQPEQVVQPTETTVQEQVTEELVDLSTVTQPAASPTSQGSQAEPVRPTSPNEQAIQVSAAAVGAGNIDPSSYDALDAEIGALLRAKLGNAIVL